jgi:hypothetical protein
MHMAAAIRSVPDGQPGPAIHASEAHALILADCRGAMMNMKRWLYRILIITLLSGTALACGRDPMTPAVSTQPTLTVLPATDTPDPARFTPTAMTATPAVVLSTSTATAVPSGPVLTSVQFALEVDPSGQLVFPASDFVSGVTRVYVRFAYRRFDGITELESTWYLNDNRVSRSILVWEGGREGEYLIWIEDPRGLNRGQWRWELFFQEAIVGGGSFVVGEGPRFVSDALGIGFDPPATWTQESETADFVTFSSPDQLQGIALHAASSSESLSELAAADVERFRGDHPDAEIELTENVTMNGEPALLQRISYQDPERGEQELYIVSAIHDGLGYSLWVLGPGDDASGLEALVAETLLSIQFSGTEGKVEP